MSNPFLDILNKPPTAPAAPPPTVRVLEEFCEGIRSYRPQALDCQLILGHPTNWGQEYRVVLISRRTDYEYTLLRAYVPATAGPVRVDFYDFKVRDFADEKQLEDGLKDFLDLPATRSVIEQYAR